MSFHSDGCLLVSFRKIRFFSPFHLTHNNCLRKYLMLRKEYCWWHSRGFSYLSTSRERILLTHFFFVISFKNEPRHFSTLSRITLPVKKCVFFINVALDFLHFDRSGMRARLFKALLFIIIFSSINWEILCPLILASKKIFFLDLFCGADAAKSLQILALYF